MNREQLEKKIILSGERGAVVQRGNKQMEKNEKVMRKEEGERDTVGKKWKQRGKGAI
jgi:hypothetical protein